MTISETVKEKKEIERIFLGFTIEAQKQIPSNLEKSKKKVIVIAGPTACGKSSLAMNFATQYGGEIISADSMQVYKGMDIGTAKASKQDQDAIHHHLIDIRNVSENFNVVDFYYEARHCCQMVHNHENIPLIVGGSGFYLHSLMFGPPSGPPSVPELRKSLEEEGERIGIEALFKRLKQLDPQYASTITVNDKQKIVRGLEIIALSGKKVSKLSWKSRRKPQNYHFLCWFFHRPREKLYSRIEQRCDEMIKNGLLDEVALLEKQGLRLNSSASQAIGYRQALEFLDSGKSKEDYKKFVETFKQASRNYAKRQITWFKNKPFFRWIDLDMHDPEVVMEIIRKDYESVL